MGRLNTVKEHESIPSETSLASFRAEISDVVQRVQDLNDEDPRHASIGDHLYVTRHELAKGLFAREFNVDSVVLNEDMVKRYERFLDGDNLKFGDPNQIRFLKYDIVNEAIKECYHDERMNPQIFKGSYENF